MKARDHKTRAPKTRALKSGALRSLGLALIAGSTASCMTQLDSTAWSRIGKGTHTVGASSGWAFYEADVELTDLDGSPDLGTGSQKTDLDPIFGAALKYNYFIADNYALGFIYEARTFDPDPVAPLDSPIDADEYTSSHFLLSTRYWSDPVGASNRWKWFTGLDLNYSPGVALDATVLYAPGFQERLSLDGDEFFTLNPVIGTSYLLRDQLSMELGFFYEFPIDSSDDTLTLNIPNGLGGTDANTIDGSLEPQGLIFFAGLTYYF